jgi:hypothetical protein
MLLIYFFLIYAGIREGNEQLQKGGWFMLAISWFLTTVVGVYNFFQRPDKYSPFKDMVRKTLMSFFDRLNKKY